MDRRLRESARIEADPLRRALLLRRAGQVSEALELLERTWIGGGRDDVAELLLDVVADQPPEQALAHAGCLERLEQAGLEAAGALRLRLFPATAAIVGCSQAIRELRGFVYDVSQSDAPIVLWGESGAGHEVSARTIHALSGRGSFHEGYGPRRHSLFRRELESQPGDGGTLYVSYAEDDQGWEEFVLEACARRGLRLVVGAIGQHPPRMMGERGWRGQRIAPLRERFEDLPSLVEELLTRVGASDAVPHLREADVKRLEWHDWPGNVRELANHVSRAVMESESAVDVTDALLQGLFGLPGEVGER